MSARIKDPAALDEQVRAMDRRLSNWSVTVLVILGLWILLSPLAPGISGYLWVRNLLGGGEGAVPRFFLGFLFLYFAGIVKEKNQLRETLRGIVTIIKKQLEARTVDSVKEAVNILVQALASEDAGTRAKVAARLEKLTGQSFGDDRHAWETWWEAEKDGFGAGGGPG